MNKEISTLPQTELWEILVPTLMGDNPVRVRHHRNWDAYVRGLAGGLTLLTPAKGQWVCHETATTIEERVIPVRVSCTRKQLDLIIDFTLRHYRQEAVMAYRLSQEVVLRTSAQCRYKYIPAKTTTQASLKLTPKK